MTTAHLSGRSEYLLSGVARRPQRYKVRLVNHAGQCTPDDQSCDGRGLGFSLEGMSPSKTAAYSSQSDDQSPSFCSWVVSFCWSARSRPRSWEPSRLRSFERWLFRPTSPPFFAFAHRAFCAAESVPAAPRSSFACRRDRSNIFWPPHPLNLSIDALKNRRRSLRAPWPGRVHVSPEAFHGPVDREGTLTDAVEGGNHPQDSVDIERFAGRLSRSRCDHQE